MKIRHGILPDWLSARLTALYGRDDLRNILSGNLAIDHWGELDGAFVCEPYSCSGDDIAALTALAKRIGGQVRLSGISEWLPERTLRITLEKRE